MNNKLLPLLGGLLAAILCSGCAAVVIGAATAAGAGTYAYVSGQLKSSESASFEKAQKAASAALSDMGYPITGTKAEPNKTEYTARGPGDKKVTVIVEKVSGTVSEFRIRVGTFGDEQMSSAIMDAIKKHL